MAKKRDFYTMSNGKPVTDGSVSQICGVIDKSGALTWWAAGQACNYVREHWKPDTAFSAEDIEEVLDAAKGAHNRRKQDAADIGTRIHKVVQLYIEGQITPEQLQDDGEKKGLQNFIHVTKGWKWHGCEVTLTREWLECDCGVTEENYDDGHKCIACEKPMRRCGYGGTADGVATLPDGMTILADFKTSNSIVPIYSMQCALYATAKPTDKSLVAAWEKITESRILHFDKELLTWEVLERSVEEQKPYIFPLIHAARWKKIFDIYVKKEKKPEKPVEKPKTVDPFSI